MSRFSSYVRRHHIALLALFVAMGGTSYAAFKLPKNSVGSKQIKANAVNSSKVKNGSLLAGDFKRGQLPKGDKGDPCLPSDPNCKGPKGDTGQQGPGAISINRPGVTADLGGNQVLSTINGVDAFYVCGNGGPVIVGIQPHQSGDTVFASGDKAENAALASLQTNSTVSIFASGSSTANLDVVAWSGTVGKLARFDLGGFHGTGACNIWGLLTPGS